MTQNQIRYQEHLETIRHDKEMENETARSNLARERETHYFNAASLSETARRNTQQEAIQREANAINAVHLTRMDDESQRHNQMVEGETSAHNENMEALQYSQNQVSKKKAQADIRKAISEARLNKARVGLVSEQANHERLKRALTTAQTLEQFTRAARNVTSGFRDVTESVTGVLRNVLPINVR